MLHKYCISNRSLDHLFPHTASQFQGLQLIISQATGYTISGFSTSIHKKGTVGTTDPQDVFHYYSSDKGCAAVNTMPSKGAGPVYVQ